MKSCKRGVILLVLVFLLLLPSVFSKTVSYNDVEIVSPDVFHCQPIYSRGRCLVDVSIQVNNENVIKINPKFQVDFSKDYDIIKFGINNIQYPITDSKATFISKDKLILQETNTINFRFWADENGEFNLTGLIYSDANFLGSVKLDPYINISVNSSYPSYHLINGTNSESSDNEYEVRNEISVELSDGDNATSYDTYESEISSNASINGIIDSYEFETAVGITPVSVRVEDSVGGVIYAVFYEGLQADGFVSTYEILNNGSITPLIDTFEYDISSGKTPTAIKVYNNTYAVGYEGAGQDGFVQTIEILNNGTILGVLDTFEIDDVDMNEPNVFWQNQEGGKLGFSSSQMVTDGVFGIGNITESNGSINRVDRYVFETTQAIDVDSINVSNNIVLVSYDTVVGGELKTLYVLDNGTINHTVDTQVFDGSNGVESDLTHLGNDLYSVVWKDTGNVGTIATFEVNSSGQISGILDTQIFETESGSSAYVHPNSMKIADEILVIVFRQGTNEGALDLWRIYDNGTISETPLDNFIYEAVQTYRQEIQHFKDDIYIISYEGDGNDGYITTVDISIESEVMNQDKALSTFFNYILDITKYYWLEIWADNSGDLTINIYLNGSDINTTNYETNPVVSGMNRFYLSDLIYDNYNFPFRVYTDTLINISEVYLIEEFEYSPLTAYLVDYYALNSSGDRIDEFNTENLEEIEKMILNFTINISYFDETINYWYFNFSMNGTNACALGNKQSSECYQAFNNEWIQFVNDSETDTFRDEGHIGDYIDATIIGLGTEEVNIVLEIDEHYQNVFKWYDAWYNFSDIRWQNDSNISLGRYVRVEVNQSLIPLDADQYKLDVRVVHNNPTVPFEAYLCNSSYVTGHPHDFGGCSLVMKKYYYELQDDGTKFRGIFTKDLINGIGDIKYVILELHTNSSDKFFAIKTYKATNPSHTIKWEYSDDYGATWNPRTDYETELNINWFYYSERSAFIYNIYAESNTTSNNLIGNITWNIDPVNNYPPLINIERPIAYEVLTQPYLIEFNIDDPNADNLNSTLFLDGDIIVRDLNYSSSYYWDNFVNESNYDLMLVVCEIGTSELYCVNHTSSITVLNYCSEDINLENMPLEDCNDVTLEWNVSYYYEDGNYATCCNVTGLGSDCHIDNGSYINSTQIDNCSILDCLYDATPYLKFFDKRIPLLCEVNKNTSYDFLTYVKADDQIIQINPERTLIDRYGEYNSFRSVNGLVNLYYTSEVLRPDRNITVIVEGQNGIFYEEMNVIPTYKDPYQLQDRLFWTWDNSGLIIGAIFMILIIGVLLLILIRYLVGEFKRW